MKKQDRHMTLLMGHHIIFPFKNKKKNNEKLIQHDYSSLSSAYSRLLTKALLVGLGRGVTML